jgi:hypothetical protein
MVAERTPLRPVVDELGMRPASLVDAVVKVFEC